jgi:sugar phosphate isomerase/epimerase
MLEQVEARDDVDHGAAIKELTSIQYEDIISIEMRPSNENVNALRVKKAVKFIQSISVGL